MTGRNPGWRREPWKVVPTFVHDGFGTSMVNLRMLQNKVIARASSPDRREAIARLLINLDTEPTVWDHMVSDFGNPLEN